MVYCEDWRKVSKSAYLMAVTRDVMMDSSRAEHWAAAMEFDLGGLKAVLLVDVMAVPKDDYLAG